MPGYPAYTGRKGAPAPFFYLRTRTCVRLQASHYFSALSSAVAAYLARGDSLRDAVAGARAFVAKAIENSQKIGAGARFLAYS